MTLRPNGEIVAKTTTEEQSHLAVTTLQEIYSPDRVEEFDDEERQLAAIYKRCWPSQNMHEQLKKAAIS